MASIVRIATWNANGLLNHKQELISFLNINKIDIILISETHFTDKTVLRIPNYTIYNTTHPDGTAHAGAAVIIKNSISHHELRSFQTEKIQAANVKVMAFPWSFTVSAIYSPPRHKISTDDYIQFFDTLGNKFICGGDWNAKHIHWGSRLVTTKGRNLLKAIMTNNYNYHSTREPTYWPTDLNKIPDLLDFYISHGIATNSVLIETNNDLSSDHVPVILNLSSRIINKELTPRLVSKQTDWVKFQQYIEEKIDLKHRIKQPEDLDRSVQYLVTLIQEAAWEATTKVTEPDHHTKNVPFYIKELIAEKRRARAKWQRSRNATDKLNYNRLTRRLRTVLLDCQNAKFNYYLKNLKQEDHTIWRATKGFKRPQVGIPPIRKTNGDWARSNKEKSNTFAEHLSKVFQPLESNIADETIEEYLDIPCQMSLPIKPISPAEIRSEIKKLNDNKAPGYDLITEQVLKMLPVKAIVLLATIYNRMLSMSYYPILWKYAQIIMIPKPGKAPENVTLYRPISLLPLLGKIFEKLLFKRLMNNTDISSQLPLHQFGFREGHSTTQQVHRIVNEISRSLEEKRYCTAVFLDVAQAFDKVWHTGLLHKLKRSLPSYYYLLLKSYLSDRFFTVKYNNEHSNYHPIKSGVPQGSVLWSST
uniref:Reverse transcriptase domain-containing protein n=1 Tax=Photinus pyralis TaxID=7054 RepID=A0A1Y1KFT3_PHOPY